MKITLNITTEDGTLLGQVKTTKAQLRLARINGTDAAEFVNDICIQAGVR